MVRLDNSIQKNKCEVSIYLKDRNKVISDLNKLEENWHQYFYNIKEISDEKLEKYLNEDSFYLEGAVCMNINGYKILSFKHWDLIDQLLSYFVQALYEIIVEKRSTSTFFFPDQPLQVSFIDMGNSLTLQLEDDTKAKCLKWDFVNEFSLNAEFFFNKVDQITFKSNYKNELMLLKEIKSNLNGTS